MRKIPYKTWLLAALLLFLPCVAHAAGLGQLRILSALGQPLVAEIDLISVQRDELPTLTARFASPEAYRQANLQYHPALISARFSIERRGNGQPYIRITSTRILNEPFVELLVELSWAQGRLVREYTALIDPPEFMPGAPPAVAAAAPPVTPQATPIAPAITAPPVDKPAAKAAPTAAPVRAGGSEYGPVKRGETLSRIAAGVKPEGVTLEQTLVSLYRSNPDAFAGNMNRLKTGRILRVPEKDEIAATGQGEAVKEVRVQTANWNAYRQRLAESAGETPARESKSAASGKIATTVEDKAAAKDAPKEVLKLSKSEPAAAPGKPGSGKPLSTQERVRVLEEEALAREKALTEANDRIAQLEKTINDMQRLLEIKGQVPPAAPAKTAPPPPAPVTKSDQVTKAEPPKADPKADAAKMEPAKDAAKAPEAPKDEPKAAPVVPPVAAVPAEAPKADAAKAEPPKSEQPAAEQPAPKPKPKVVAPPPPPAPDLVDEILGEPLYMMAGGGLLAVLLGGLYYWFARRRATAAGDDDKFDKQAPKLGGKSTADHAAQMATTTIMPAPLVTDDVDPLAEADLYLNFGRDAQAEEVLKEALEKNPKHEAAQLKLLQIYAARKDKAGFEKVARNLHGQIGSASENWLKAAAMGYAFDPDNALYEVGKSVPAASIPGAGGPAAGSAELDFDLELAPAAAIVTPTDIELDAGKTTAMQAGDITDVGAAFSATSTQDITGDSGVTRADIGGAEAPEFTLDVTAAMDEPAEPDITVDAPGDAGGKNDITDVTGELATPMANAIDFNFDEPAAAPAAPASEAGKGFTHDGTVILSPENRDKAAGLSLDFETGSATGVQTLDVGTTAKMEPDINLDLGTPAPIAPDFKLDDINLNFDETPAAEGAKADGGGAKDDHWYDVQTKFDLAKAYQEMGDKDGAREILQEVLKEGDAGQQTEAKQLLDSLS